MAEQCTHDHDKSGDIMNIAAALHMLWSVSWDNMSTASDEPMLCLMSLDKDGFTTTSHELPSDLQYYLLLNDGLHTSDEALFCNNCIITPLSLWLDVLRSIKSAYEGISSMILLTKLRFSYGIISDIRDMHAHCMAPSCQNPPATPPIISVYSFQSISAVFALCQHTLPCHESF